MKGFALGLALKHEAKCNSETAYSTVIDLQVCYCLHPTVHNSLSPTHI